MPLGYGMHSYVGVANEARWGVAASSPTDVLFMPDDGDGYAVEQDNERATPIGTGGYIQESVKVGKHNPRGNIALEMPFQGSEIFLQHAFGGGTPTTAAQGSGVYQHTFKLNDPWETSGLYEGMTFWVQRGKESGCTWKHSGTRVHEFELAARAHGFLRMRMGATSYQATTQDAIVSGAPTAVNGTGMHAFYTATLSYAGATLSVPDFSLLMQVGLDKERFPSASRYRIKQTRNGPVSVTLRATVEFDSTSLYSDFLAATGRAFFFTFIGPTITGGLTYFVRVDAGEGASDLTVIESYKPQVKSVGRILVPVEMRFYRRRDESFRELKLIIQNKRATVP